MNRTLFTLSLAACAALTCACHRGGPENLPDTAPPEPHDPCSDGICADDEDEDSCPRDCSVRERFGVDHLDVEMLPWIEAMGVSTSDHRGLSWGDVEPEAPVGGEHDYQGLPEDHWIHEAIAMLEAADRELCLEFRVDDTEWAIERDESITVTDPTSGLDEGGLVRILPEHLDGWRAAVVFLLETLPVVHTLQVSNEPENTWVDAEGFVEALCVAHEAVQQVNQEHGRDVQVLVGGFNMATLTEQDEETIQELLDQYPDIGDDQTLHYAQKLHVATGVLAQGGDCFDVLSLHHDHGATWENVDHVVGWFRERMQREGYDKPVWYDDMHNGYYPKRNDEGWYESQDQALLDALESDPPDAEILALYNEATPSWLVRKASAAFTAGIERVFFSPGHDMPTYYMAAWRYAGLTDEDGQPKAAYHSAKLLVEKLDGFVRAERLEGLSDAWVYRFEHADRGDVIVAWSEAEGGTTVDLSAWLGGPQLQLTSIITQLDESGDPVVPAVESVPAEAVPLDEAPVFLEDET